MRGGSRCLAVRLSVDSVPTRRKRGSPPRVWRPTPSSPISRADMALRAGRYTIGVDAFGVAAWLRGRDCRIADVRAVDRR